MTDNILAYTAPGTDYPGYVSINRTPDGDVEVTVREAPTVHENSIHICGFASDKGKPGRCTPGDENCNNYCNMAPQIGPMQAHPKPCTQISEGRTVTFTMPAAEWESLEK